MAEACGSRTQTFDSQVTANDDVAASAEFQLESIGVKARSTNLAPLFLKNNQKKSKLRSDEIIDKS